MKQFIILFSILVLIRAKLDQYLPSSNYIINTFNEYNIDVQFYPVITSDGYILDLYRAYDKTFESYPRSAVLFIHGFMSSAEDFIYGGPNNSMAFYLINHGYDVYLGNVRGSKYGQRHVTLNPNKDVAFWNFCWNEIGKYDFPVIFHKVRQVSKQDKINFVGHMEGATSFLVFQSEHPSYNDYIKYSILVGPIVYLGHSQHKIIKQVVDNYHSKPWIMKNVGISTFKPSQELLLSVLSDCVKSYSPVNKNDFNICDNNYFLFNGYKNTHFNQTIINKAYHQVPSGGSVKEVIGFAKNMAYKKFLKNHDIYNNVTDEEYDLSKVQSKIIIFYTSKDDFTQYEDIKILIDHLPNVVYSNDYASYYDNNIDFIYGTKIDLNFYNNIISSLESNYDDDYNTGRQSRYKY